MERPRASNENKTTYFRFGVAFVRPSPVEIYSAVSLRSVLGRWIRSRFQQVWEVLEFSCVFVSSARVASN